MENDKQMNNLHLEKVKKTFLNDDLLTKNIKPQIYSLPDEFVKSKRNKSFLVYGLILLYASIIAGGVYLLTAIEEQKNRRVEVNIAEFRQFNLMELLEEKKASEAKLIKLQGELEKVRADSLRQIQKLTPEEQRKAMAELNEKLKKLEAEYEDEVKSKAKALKTLQKSITSEKRRTQKSIREVEELTQDYQKLKQKKSVEIKELTVDYEAKITELTSEYERKIESLILRYNPIYSKGEIKTVINSDLGIRAKGFWRNYAKNLSDAGLLSEGEAKELREKIEAQKIILDNLGNIRFTNSVPLALKRLEQLSQSIIGDYEAICKKLGPRASEKPHNLAGFEYALNCLARNNNVDGYVLDARKSSQLIIFLKDNSSVRKGDRAQVLKNDAAGSIIADIEFYFEADQLTAKVKKRYGKIGIAPFDKVRLRK